VLSPPSGSQQPPSALCTALGGHSVAVLGGCRAALAATNRAVGRRTSVLQKAGDTPGAARAAAVGSSLPGLQGLVLSLLSLPGQELFC